MSRALKTVLGYVLLYAAGDLILAAAERGAYLGGPAVAVPRLCDR